MFKPASSDRFNPGRLYPNPVNLILSFLNTIFQIRLFAAGKIRWLFHFFVFAGFLYLVTVHAFHQVTAVVLFDYYDPTVDPFQFLRNLFGSLVVAGCILFFLRRGLRLRVNQIKSNWGSHLKYKGLVSIILVFLIVGTGFLLEASKIISEPVFMEMVEDYSDLEEGDELEELKLFWQEKAFVSFDPTVPADPEKLKNGQVLNEVYCISCHSDIRSSFVSCLLADLMSFYGTVLNQTRVDVMLYRVHYGLCLALIVFLPFSRLNHIFLIPLSIAVKNQAPKTHHQKTAQVFGASLFACTNCGYCSQVCSVYPHFQITGNPDVLPHSKIETLKKIADKHPDVSLWGLQKGNNACTQCNKCTQICPSGIDLQTLWAVTHRIFSDNALVNNQTFFNRILPEAWADLETEPRMLIARQELVSDLIEKTDAFENCIQCTICTNVCPVVEYDSKDNDYTPQQVMNLLRLDQKHLASGTRMVWTCLTCYACQDICPQKIPVTDIILELRHLGGVRADAVKLQQTVKKRVEIS
ncbi:MAG: 4Fe-4S dicluster domain-containing protein [Proteobacteria bacterium]|nr:4Fe-4S dicluster domain-containing protein [Pseudomonadota bacterium]MBU1388857.1 4Fe-4S dicluster domain-containing protein [Pseudomonadota bacterium]MBU1542238.1 4Fe-4S dicluster domain-containing protein [Pseudomonadota bacterium]MBU2430362.1 4Fe-4S dicluster domain-containing protein [Pseudomonadota bacterium]MBU2480472.1 4Fe-4S dicluster domain-containing protein [Pseudomonadota bacterium]